MSSFTEATAILRDATVESGHGRSRGEHASGEWPTLGSCPTQETAITPTEHLAAGRALAREELDAACTQLREALAAIRGFTELANEFSAVNSALCLAEWAWQSLAPRHASIEAAALAASEER